METNTTPAATQFDWHRKPAGWGGAPCPTCGAEEKRLRATHRALTADETHIYGGSHVKRISRCFGLDWDTVVIR